jgi:two-component system chemotaxis response regulator CheY
VHQQRTILLAEPDARLRAAWRGGLDGMGFTVRESADGSTALRTALHSEVTLLITELYLPSGDERCLVRATRREPGLKRVKILVVSEHAEAEDREWALAAGADAYLIKPIRLGRILQVAVRLATTRQQSRAEVRASHIEHTE